MVKHVSKVNSVFDENNLREIKRTNNVFGKFLIEKGLYDTIEITESNFFELVDLISGEVRIDTYCTKCGEKRVFTCDAILYFSDDNKDCEVECSYLSDEVIRWRQGRNLSMSSLSHEHKESWVWTGGQLLYDTRVMVFKFYCTMDKSHHLDFVVLNEGNTIRKIGQYPSFADVSNPEIKEYRKVLSETDIKELKRAVGLFANGIGIGSFVYLRRIFERIINQAGKKAIEEEKINENDFSKARIDEKIKVLKDYLPKALVSNTVFYGIVSKGIHELSEEECLEYFPVMKSFIMLVLMQWEEMRKVDEEEKALEAALNIINSKVK